MGAGHRLDRSPGSGLTKVVVVGLGRVGLPLAVRAAEVGYDVVGLEIDARKLQALRVRRSYLGTVPDARLRALGDDVFRATADESWLTQFDVAVIAVAVDLREDAPDMSGVEAAATAVGRFLLPGATVVLESTSCPTATEHLVAGVLEARSRLTAGVDFHLGLASRSTDPVIRDFYGTLAERA
jgi:UDP-N-acetyl-D-glucosamine dehydrogenase